MYRAWSVRTYNIITRNGYKVENAAEAEALALKIMRHEVRSAGRRIATELFRAAGYGVNQIYQALNGEVNLDAVRQWVEWIDKYNR